MLKKQMIGTPHTTKVGHTFPLVTLGFKCNKPEWKPVQKMCLFFFLFLNSLGNTHVTTLGLRDCPGGDLDLAPA